jgi:hypothetical protein
LWAENYIYLWVFFSLKWVVSLIVVGWLSTLGQGNISRATPWKPHGIKIKHNHGGPLWSYGSWIYNYLCNQCPSPLTLWVRIPLMARCSRYNIMWSSLSVIYGISVVFSGYSGLLYQENWPLRYNWNIVESDVINHKP